MFASQRAQLVAAFAGTTAVGASASGAEDNGPARTSVTEHKKMPATTFTNEQIIAGKHASMPHQQPPKSLASRKGCTFSSNRSRLAAAFGEQAAGPAMNSADAKSLPPEGDVLTSTTMTVISGNTRNPKVGSTNFEPVGPTSQNGNGTGATKGTGTGSHGTITGGGSKKSKKKWTPISSPVRANGTRRLSLRKHKGGKSPKTLVDVALELLEIDEDTEEKLHRIRVSDAEADEHSFLMQVRNPRHSMALC